MRPEPAAMSSGSGSAASGLALRALAQEGEALRQKLRAVQRFLSVALPIANEHTGEFYTRGAWQELVGDSPETVLAAFRRHHPPAQEQGPPRSWDVSEFSKIFCETSHKLVNLEMFLKAAKDHSLPHLGVCIPLRQLLGLLNGKEPESGDEKTVTDEFMNHKKSHEVMVMSRLINSIAKYCGTKQVIDLGSGKGYLSSFLSMRYDLKVYGIDSSSSNTHGAKERNRKLKKYWKVYRKRVRANSRSQESENEDEQRIMEDSVECKLNIDEDSQSDTIDLSHGCASVHVPPVVYSGDFTDSALSSTSDGTEIAEMDTSELPESELSFLNLLPVDAVETVTSYKYCQKVLSEEEKEHRKMENMKAKARKFKDSSVYSPLTSYITSDTELHDVIVDLEDSIMVGLHTCGDLAPNTLRIFAAKPEIKAVCSVGCCYHFLSEEFEVQTEANRLEKWGFPMSKDLKEEGWCCGRNARMSACLALERVAVGQRLPLESLFYRAVLQVIIKECYDNVKSNSPQKWSFSRLASVLFTLHSIVADLKLATLLQSSLITVPGEDATLLSSGLDTVLCTEV